MKNVFALSAALPILLTLSACSSEAPAGAEKKEEPRKIAKTEAPMSGKDAYWEMYKPAREWATDIQVLSLKSESVPGVKIEDGKAGGWTAVFVSPSKSEARTITWALSAFGDYRKGMNAAQPVKWGGPTTKSKPFAMGDVSIDSDAAMKAAAGNPKASGWLKEHSDKPASFYLGNDQRFTAPVWVVEWGNEKDGYRALINASNGEPAK
jgi:hypothetical protein